jgi:hypothetical protein
MPFDPQQLKDLGPVLGAVVILLAVCLWGVVKILEIRSKTNGNGQGKEADYQKALMEAQQLETQKTLTITLQTIVLPMLQRLTTIAENNAAISAQLTGLMQEWSPVIHRVEALLDSKQANGQAKAHGSGGKL